MPTVIVTTILPHSQQAVWDAWANFGNVDMFHPAVKSSRIIGGPSSGRNAARRCDFYDGSAIEEKVTVFDPPYSIGWALTKPPGPIKKGDALVELKAQSPSQTRVTFTLTFSMKLGPVGWLLGVGVVKGAMKKALIQLLKGLEDHLATGKRVGDKGVLEAA